MKKLSKNEAVGVAVAVAVVGYLLFGSQLVGFFTSNNTSGAASAESQATAMDIPNSGVKAEDVVVGTGVAAQAGDKVTVNYVGELVDGKVFDSSYDRNQPFTFTLGQGQVIKGWDMGVIGMRVGGKRRLIIAPDYGYGSQNVGPIPANSVLVFDVELLNVSH